MKAFLVCRDTSCLHYVQAFPESDKRGLRENVKSLRKAGYKAKVFIAQDLAEVVAQYPSWFEEEQ